MIEIVFQNEHFVVCDKESGVLSTPSRHEDSDVRRCLGTELQKQLATQIFPVHRLDFEVSGLVLYAKNPASHARANAWFENKQVSKSYSALTTNQDYSHIPVHIKNERKLFESLTPGQCFRWETHVLRGKRRSYENPLGKLSVTEAQFTAKDTHGFLHWDLRPITGRAHQLRFDLSRHGFPIVGDKLYGSNVEREGSSIALRSYKIDFSHAPGALALGLPEKIEIVSL